MKKFLLFILLLLAATNITYAQRIGTSKELNEDIDYAYMISGNDINFIKTIERESSWNYKAIWDKWKAFWLCQINTRWHKLPKKYLTDIKTQINVCWEMYSDYEKKWILHKRFYWYNSRKKADKLFE